MMNRKLCMRGRNRLRNILVSAAVPVLFLGAALNAQIPANIPPRNDYAPLANALESLIRQEMADKDLPAFSIALVDGNQVVWAQGFGYQDPEHKIPATAHTIYRVGSVSKLFTDIGIMQMVEARKINLDTSCKPIHSGFSSDRIRSQTRSL